MVISELSTFTVPLRPSDHSLAEQFRRQHRDSAKAKQVYLNTLAVSAVNFYLRCMGVKTNWEASQSRDPVIQAAMDVADLEVCDRGKLECRPVLPDVQVVYIPPEVWSDRIGCVAVQLDPSLQTATLLGFTEISNVEEVPVSQLRSLDSLLEHLSQSAPAVFSNPSANSQVNERVNLSQWLENLFETGWRSLDSLLLPGQPHFAVSLRNDRLSEATVKRAKLIDLGLSLKERSVALMVAIMPSAGQINASEAKLQMEILVQMHPMGGETYLPADLRMSLLSPSGEMLQEVRSRSHDNYIQLKRFRGMPGECFDIQVAFHETCLTEMFTI
ncbi:DUF1822 family protein [Leptolyngbya sp. FACHB-671]|uniref:DUF1822 family protein n=1 Tax=Leptolyngbya sp. FACHB-671 TaxID=2692812 RepID=UPI0016833BDA|nr:DUF1822 family protein [Leptolyngbya sp. FACHB-671]MBD2066431.1 DUF1822 family protein [Leptolyngbya sp. FACHB-671]